MDKKFLITATHFCCPNFLLDKTKDKCVKSNNENSVQTYLQLTFILLLFIIQVDSNSTNLHLELLDNMSEIANLIKSNDNDSNKQRDNFFSDFNQLYDLISSDAFNTNTNKKWTVYLWDNRSMINYIRTSVLRGTDTLSDLMSTILNHFVDYHYPTQSIIKNDDLIKLNTAADRQLRLSTFNLYDVIVFYFSILEMDSC